MSADPDNAAKGRDAIVARAEMILGGFSDAKLEIVSISVDGSRVCAEWRFSGTHPGVFLGVPASGQRVVNLGAGVQEFDESGKIVSEHAYWDAAVFLRTAGALPASAVLRRLFSPLDALAGSVGALAAGLKAGHPDGTAVSSANGAIGSIESLASSAGARVTEHAPTLS